MNSFDLQYSGAFALGCPMKQMAIGFDLFFGDVALSPAMGSWLSMPLRLSSGLSAVAFALAVGFPLAVEFALAVEFEPETYGGSEKASVKRLDRAFFEMPNISESLNSRCRSSRVRVRRPRARKLSLES